MSNHSRAPPKLASELRTLHGEAAEIVVALRQKLRDLGQDGSPELERLVADLENTLDEIRAELDGLTR